MKKEDFKEMWHNVMTLTWVHDHLLGKTKECPWDEGSWMLLGGKGLQLRLKAHDHKKNKLQDVPSLKHTPTSCENVKDVNSKRSQTDLKWESLL